MLAAIGLMADRLFLLDPSSAAASPITGEQATQPDELQAATPARRQASEPLAKTIAEATERAGVSELGLNAFQPLLEDSSELSRSSDVRFDCTMAVRDPSGGLAVINGKPLKPGQQVDGATLVRVMSGNVVIEYDSQEITLPVGKQQPAPTRSTTTPDPGFGPSA
ncbi:MAG: hypothetical protein AAF108_07390 [Planctomycetota bacterium]